MTWEKFDKPESDEIHATESDHDFNCWFCGHEWSTFGSHCPNCGEQYPES